MSITNTMNNESHSPVSQFTNHQLRQLRHAPTIEEKQELLIKFKTQQPQSQELQWQLEELHELLQQMMNS